MTVNVIVRHELDQFLLRSTVTEHDTVQSVTQQLEKQLGRAVVAVKYAGHELDSGASVGSYIPDTTVLRFFVQTSPAKQAGEIGLYMKTVTGKTIEIRCIPGVTVKHLKQLLHHRDYEW